jgi:hypothetical protein
MKLFSSLSLCALALLGVMAAPAPALADTSARRVWVTGDTVTVKGKVSEVYTVLLNEIRFIQKVETAGEAYNVEIPPRLVQDNVKGSIPDPLLPVAFQCTIVLSEPVPVYYSSLPSRLGGVTDSWKTFWQRAQLRSCD